MNRRLLLAVCALALVSVTAGCMGIGTGPVPNDRLDEAPQQPYAWNQTERVHITIEADAQFRAVYRLNGTQLSLYRRDGFGGRNPLDVRALRYRYPNGTVVTGSELKARGGSVARTRDEVTVTLPEGAPPDGKLAFTAGSTPKRFSLPTFVKGSYEVVLPPERRVGFFLFGSVSPRADETAVVDGRTHLRWHDLTARSVIVQFYLQRDLLIFGAAAAVIVVIGAAGLLYYRRQIEALREQREELGLDVDTDDDDFGGGPPPGMG